MSNKPVFSKLTLAQVCQFVKGIKKDGNARNDLNTKPKRPIMFSFSISYYDDQWTIWSC